MFFAGKGGVGKTTCAAARATLEARAGRRVLVVSTDPAHSLGDALGIRLSPRPRRAAPKLDALELDGPRAFARWLGRHRRLLGDLLERGTWLDRDDADALLELTMPGVDELIGLLEISRLAGERYDLVVVDTAPTGHALRLLSAPETVSRVAEALDAMQEEHRVVRRQLARIAGPDAADRFVAELVQQAAAMSGALRDRRRASFVWVTLPEPMSIAEMRDGVAALDAIGIHVADIVVNRVLPPLDPCPLCGPRRAEQRRAIADIRKTFSRQRLRILPDALREPRGLAALRQLGNDVEVARPFTAATTPAGSKRRARLEAKGSAATVFENANVVFVGGKGGVGKTTVAAAIALQLARSLGDKSVLLLSTDPAHSLADVLDARVGDDPKPLRGGPPNLFVRELDAPRMLADEREVLEAALGEVSSGVTSIAAAARLLDLAPPGIDELLGMLSIIDARRQHEAVVIDMAPTGHALRLLDMPDVAREWTQLLMRVLLKYREVVRPGRLAQELVDASRSTRELQELVRDPARTRFLVVTRAAALPRAETTRLVRELGRRHLVVSALVVNARTLAPARCRRCLAAAAAERVELDAFAKLARAAGRRRDCAIIQTPLVAPAPRGIAALDRWARHWIRDAS